MQRALFPYLSLHDGLSLTFDQLLVNRVAEGRETLMITAAHLDAGSAFHHSLSRLMGQLSGDVTHDAVTDTLVEVTQLLQLLDGLAEAI